MLITERSTNRTAVNGMSQALTLALYILVSKERGETPRFPGNEYFYNCVDDSSYAPSIADMSIWAVTNEHCKNEAFNHTNGDVFVWRYFWPRLGKYFGLDVRNIALISPVCVADHLFQVAGQSRVPDQRYRVQDGK